ncbi:MAG: hypothetical protein AB1486_06810 [Planctomycetota bacterium]
MSLERPSAWRRALHAVITLVCLVLAAPLGLAVLVFMVLLWPHELVLKRRPRGSPVP